MVRVFIELNKVIRVLILLSILVMIVTYNLKNRPPDYEDISPFLQHEPIQTNTHREPFHFAYKGLGYNVYPVQNYEIWGLVASHNNIRAFSDIYHDDDSVDLKDFCMLWGENLTDNDFHKVSIKNTSWTCTFKYPAGVKFSDTHISNNHLLAANPKVERVIKDVRPWDQIRMKGLLVNYTPDDNPNWIRSTSTVRDDTGCEVIYVEDIEIISRANGAWYAIFNAMKYVIGALFAIKIIFFLTLPYSTRVK